MTKRIASGGIFSAFFVLAALTLGGCASVKPDTETASQGVTQPADLTLFFKLAQQARLNDVIYGDSPVTIFAPTNEALQALPAATLDQLAKDPERLKALLTYHVVSGKLLPQSVTENTLIGTLNGAKLNVSKAGDFITLDDAMVTGDGTPIGHGVIYKIDRVLTPPSVKK